MGTLPVRTVFSRLGQGTTVFPYFRGVQIAHIGFAEFYQLNGKFIQLLKIIRSVIHPVFPVKSQPAYIRLNGFHVFHIFFAGVGIIKAQVANPPVVSCQSEVKTNRFGMADVKIAVRFGGKTCMYSAAVFTGLQVLRNDGLDKIAR